MGSYGIIITLFFCLFYCCTHISMTDDMCKRPSVIFENFFAMSIVLYHVLDSYFHVGSVKHSNACGYMVGVQGQEVSFVDLFAHCQ